jgi:hypothetical protein
LSGYNIKFYFILVRESWNRYPVGILVGNTYQMGDYDECVELGVRYPVKGQYCLAEIKLIPPTGRNYSFKRTEDLDDFGINHAWKTVLGVSYCCFKTYIFVYIK